MLSIFAAYEAHNSIQCTNKGVFICRTVLVNSLCVCVCARASLRVRVRALILTSK